MQLLSQNITYIILLKKEIICTIILINEVRDKDG